ncbi:MAG: peptide deformylase [Gaiellaceae bacterium]
MAHDHQHDHDHEHEDDREGGATEEELRAEVEAEAVRRYALAQIRQYGDPALRLTAREVIDFDDDLRRLADRMVGLMHDAQGVGLAATQVGVLRRVFVFQPDEDGPRVVVNPTVAERGDEKMTDSEGCLSLQGVHVPVERALALTIEGKDPSGEEVRHELAGYAARVAQHELDHLNGVLVIDLTDEEHRKEALATLRPRVSLR